MLLIGFLPMTIFDIQEKREVKQYENQVVQIEQYIAEGNYDYALTLTYQLPSNYSTSWTETRNNLIIRIKGLQGELEGKIMVPTTDVVDKNYTDIVNLFVNAGFTNVTSENAHDLITGWITKEGTVIEVSINGNTNFSVGDCFEPDVLIIVRYHGF